MKPKIEVGQMWEAGDGSRALVIGISNQVKGAKSNRKQPVICLDINGQVGFYTPTGQYYKDVAGPDDLVTLLPAECDGFDWQPEPKWRDARPEDLTYPNKACRFRDRNCDMWENGTLVGIAYRGDTLVWVDQHTYHYWQCQVQEDTCK